MKPRRLAIAAATASSVTRSKAPPPDFGGAVMVREDVAVTAVSATEMAVTVTAGELGTLEGAV